MSEGLDIFIVDDDATVCDVVSKIVRKFYTWGGIYTFTDPEAAISVCTEREIGAGIFIVDVFLGGKTGFSLLEKLKEKFPAIHEDTIIISGNASDEVVNQCIAAGVTHLLEKPLRPYALQLAVLSIVMKYLRFAKILLQDQIFAERISRIF